MTISSGNFFDTNNNKYNKSNRVVINSDGYYPCCPFCYTELKEDETICHNCEKEVDWSWLNENKYK